MRKSIFAILILGLVTMTGCGAEQKVTISPDFSSNVVMEMYTTAEEEEAILEDMKELGSTEDMTYAQLMESMEFSYAGKKTIDGVTNSCYSSSAKNTAAKTKSMFVELTKEKAVYDISADAQTANKDFTSNSSMNMEGMKFFYFTVTYPFKVAKANGTIQSDGYTVQYDILELQKKKVSRIYALSNTAFAGTDKITVKGVKNKKAYKKAVTVKVSAKSAVASFKVNGKNQTGNSFYASKNGKYKVEVKTASGKKKTLSFYVDKKKPTTNIKNNKKYKKTVKITFKDSISGIKKATLNGKKINSGKKVKKNGKYTLKIYDKAGNVKTVKFTIKK
ncbi:MAG: hypothetical protein IJ429_02980 [Lachnospiraceae bacterium]|nr:hypothetical protein [Lachnospiraceae bacterium]